MSSSSIRAQIDQVKRKLETYEERKKALEKIRKKLGGDFDNNVSAAQRHNSSLTSALYNGLSGGSLGVSRLCGEIDDEREKAVWSDRSLSSADDSMEREISRCQSEISRLESELTSLQAQLQAALEAEAQARREALASMLGL